MRRSIGLFLMIGVVLPLAVAANASAQGTVIQFSPQTVSPGQLVTVTGGSFNNTAAGASLVNIRLQHRDGQVILEGANLNGRAQLDNVQFPMPAVAPGIYLVIATQTYANGRQVAFTPGRTRIRVLAAGAKGAAAPGGAGPTGLLSAGVILALILLAGGSVLAATRLRAHNRPTLGN